MRSQHYPAVALAMLMAGSLAYAQGQAQPRAQQTTRGQNETQQMTSRLKQREPAAQLRGRRPAQAVLVTSAGRIASAPAQFYGVPVSVHTQVGRTYSPHVFTLEEAAWWQFGGPVAVIVPSPRPGAALDANDWVTVVGTVRPFVAAELERDFDWFDLDGLPDINVELNGRPVIVADTVRTSDGMIVAQPAQPTTRVLVASAGEIADVPGRFYGHTVSVGAEVENVWSPRVFTLDEDQWFAGPDVLVFNPNPIAAGVGDLDGDIVRVLGTVRPFVVAEFEADYDWFDAADYAAFDLQRMEQRPVIVASSIIGENDRELVQFTPDLAIDVAEAELAPRMEQWARWAERQQREERGTTGQQNQPGR